MTPIKSLLTVGIGAGMAGLSLLATIGVMRRPIIPQISETLLPERLALRQWTLRHSTRQPQVSSTASYDRLLQGHTYQFYQGDQTLELKLGYFFNTNGDVLALGSRYNPHLTNPDSSQSHTWSKPQTSPQIGYVLLGRNQNDDNILVTCINAKGQNSVTKEQFMDNRLQHDFNLPQLGLWFLGRSQFPDKRCLWGYLRLSGSHQPDISQQQLQHIWAELQPQLQNIL